MLPVMKLSINSRPSVFGLQQLRNRLGHVTAVSSPTFTTVRLGELYIDYGARMGAHCIDYGALGSTLHSLRCAWEHITVTTVCLGHITLTTVRLGAYYSDYGALGSTLQWLRCSWDHITLTTVCLGAYYSDYGALGSILQWLRCAWEHITVTTVHLGAHYGVLGLFWSFFLIIEIHMAFPTEKKWVPPTPPSYGVIAIGRRWVF